MALNKAINRILSKKNIVVYSKNLKWNFSIVDVVTILTDSPHPRKYWSVLKNTPKKRRK